MESYQELNVWKKAVSLVVEVYRLTKNFPREELYALSSQIQKASISIPANIAEGWGTKKEYIQFLKIARGSLLELETHLIISQKLNYITQKDLEVLLMKTQEVGKMLNGLINSLGRGQEPGNR